MRTTVSIRDDIYEILLRQARSKRKLSEEVNKALADHLIKEKRIRMFGSCPDLEEFAREEGELDRFD